MFIMVRIEPSVHFAHISLSPSLSVSFPLSLLPFLPLPPPRPPLSLPTSHSPPPSPPPPCMTLATSTERRVEGFECGNEEEEEVLGTHELAADDDAETGRV